MSQESKEESEREDTEFEWTPYAELQLLNALAGLKCIGINYHFCLAVVYERFTSALNADIPLETVKRHLDTFYDFKNAEKLVGEIPFPNHIMDFSLPADEFPNLGRQSLPSESEVNEKNVDIDNKSDMPEVVGGTGEKNEASSIHGAENEEEKPSAGEPKVSVSSADEDAPRGKKAKKNAPGKKKLEKKVSVGKGGNPKISNASPVGSSKKGGLKKSISSKAGEKICKDKPIVKLTKSVFDESGQLAGHLYNQNLKVPNVSFQC